MMLIIILTWIITLLISDAQNYSIQNKVKVNMLSLLIAKMNKLDLVKYLFFSLAVHVLLIKLKLMFDVSAHT